MIIQFSLLRGRRVEWLALCGHQRLAQFSSEGADDTRPVRARPVRARPVRAGAVMKALAGTVQPVESPLFSRGRGRADPLYPGGRGHQMFYVQHLEAGKAAARSVVQRWPKLFPQHTSDQNPSQAELRSKPILDRLLDERKAGKAWHVYLTMKRQGKKISLDKENELLALFSYEGLANPKLTKIVSDEHISWPDRAPERTHSEHSKQLTGCSVRGWSSKNIPESMFSRMRHKDGATYDAIIQGLVKHRRFGRAFQLFQEMRDCQFQASLGTYNALLSAIAQSGCPQSTTEALLREMSQLPVVAPDINTVNHLLSIASKTGNQASLIRIMREMNYLRLEPTLSTFSILLAGLTKSSSECRGSSLLQAIQFLESNKSALTLQQETDLYFFLQAFTTARQVRSAQLARRLKKLSDHSHGFLVDKQGLAMAIYLSTLVRSGSFSAALSEYHQLVPTVLVPAEWLFRELFELCFNHQHSETALSLWKDTQKFFVPLTKMDTLNNLCKALSISLPKESLGEYIAALEQVRKQFDKNELQYSNILISSLVKAYALAGDLDKAWRCYGLFPSPNFVGLMTLLKSHNSLGHKEKTVAVLEDMVQQGMYMPQRFVKDILWSSGVKESRRQEILARLSANNMQATEENQVIFESEDN